MIVIHILELLIHHKNKQNHKTHAKQLISDKFCQLPVLTKHGLLGIVSMSVYFTTRSKDRKKRPGGETGHGSNPQQPMPQQALTTSLERQFREAKKM